MALATASSDGRPSVRVVLCRGIDDKGIVFFTSYDSRKGRELAARPQAAAVFFWASTRHQVRVEGEVVLLPASASDSYFRSRPRGSQLSASVSPQSAPIESLEDLRERRRQLEESLNGGEVQRPPNWGGYRLCASTVELWTGGEDRLHDRVRYELRGEVWVSQRLAP